VAPDLAEPNLQVAGSALCPFGEHCVWLKAFDQNGTVVGHVAPTCCQELPALTLVGSVDEVAGQDDGSEAPPEIEPLDASRHRLGSPNVRKHLFGFVDCHDAVAELHEAMRRAAGGAAQLEDLASRGNDSVNLLWLTE